MPSLTHQAARRVSKQITGNIADQIASSQASVKKAAMGRDDRRRSTQMGAGIDAVNRGNRRLGTVKEDTAENLKRIRQVNACVCAHACVCVEWG
jgi:hypothetical protein